MKISFYRMLGIAADATPAEIATAYQRAVEMLEPAVYRGDSESVNQARLLKEGYAVLTHPERRLKYDHMLAAESAAVTTSIALDSESNWSSERNIFTLLIALLIAVLGAVAYFHITAKMEDARYAHRAAVAKEQEKKNRQLAVDGNQSIVLPPQAPSPTGR